MENVTRAFMMAFSMLIFVIGFSYSMYLINKLSTTSNVLLDSVSTTKYYDNIEISSGDVTTRDVDISTIIPTLYRYYKESYAVKIVDSDNSLIQLFDVNIESKIARAAAAIKLEENSELQKLKKSIYNDKDKKAYMFEAPWTGSTDEDTRARIDYFLNGTKGYINNTLVDYSKISFLKTYGNKTFEESFVEYSYAGETISTENGIETITGSTQESSKIIITYKVKN